MSSPVLCDEFVLSRGSNNGEINAGMDDNDRGSRQKSIYQIWSSPNYVLFVLGSAGSHVTVWMQRVGIGWLAWELTHSTGWLGAVAAADLAPMIVLAPFAGALADRMDALKMVRIFQVLFVIQAMIISALTLTGLITIELLFFLSLMTGFTHPFWLASRQKVMPATVGREHVSTIVALDSASFQTARFIGPALAGLLIPLTGVGGIFVAHTGGTLLFLISLFLISVRLSPPRNLGKRRILGDIADGFSYILRHGGIPYMLLLMASVSVFLRPIQDMLPAFAGQVFKTDAVGLSWLISGMGVGAMLSAGRIAMRGEVEGLTRAAFGAGVAVVLAAVLLAMTTVFWAGVLAAIVFGYSFNTVSTSVQAIIHSTVPDDMRGRVVSFYMLVFRGMPALGALGLGLLAEFLGLRPAALISAALCFAIWMSVVPRYRAIKSSNEGHLRQ